MEIDIVEPLDLTERGKVYITVIGEYWTRSMTAKPLEDQTADSVYEAFPRRIVLVHGVPEKVLTDQGTNFLTETMDDLYKKLGVRRKTITAYRP